MPTRWRRATTQGGKSGGTRPNPGSREDTGKIKTPREDLLPGTGIWKRGGHSLGEQRPLTIPADLRSQKRKPRGEGEPKKGSQNLWKNNPWGVSKKRGG